MAIQQLGAPPSNPSDTATKSYVDARTPPVVKNTAPPSDTNAIWIDTN